MANLFIATTKTGEPLLAKHSPEVSVLPVWRSKEAVVAYIESIQMTDMLFAGEFTFEIFDSANEDFQKLGIKFFLHLN
jgi:hypothetical protein